MAKINPQEEQQIKLQELGSHLQEVRRQQDVSLESIAQKTCIQISLLKAIESGNLERLPEPIYIQGLLKQFANVLGLNGTDFAKDFPLHSDQQRQLKYYSFWRLPSLQLRPLHLYLLYIFIVFLAVKGLSNWLKYSNFQVNNPTNIQQQEPVVNSVNPPLDHNTSMVKTQNPQLHHKIKPVVVNITVKDPSWIMVMVDGKKEFEGTLVEGTHKTWTANQQLTIRTGNAGGLFVAFNDQKARQLGEPGKTQEVTFEANHGS